MAGLTSDALAAAASVLASDIDSMQLHSGDPGSSGTSNTTSAGSESVTPSADSSGGVSIGTTDFTGGAASGDCTHVSLWAGSTFYGAFALSGDQAFNAAGQYTVDSVTITSTAS